MIITRTPYRLSFFGGGTDYPAWYEKNGGLIIGTTFDRYCYITCRRLPPFFEYKTRVVYSKVEAVTKVEDIQHVSVKACLEYLGMKDGLEIHHDGDLPARSGTGSSSTFTVGMLMALHGLNHRMPTQAELAAQAIHIEQNVLKENVGIQDQILAATGGLQVIEIAKGQSDYKVQPLLVSPDYKVALQNHVMIGFTGHTRTSSAIAASQVARLKSGESRMGEIADIAQAGLNAFRNQADLSEVGRLIREGWLVKRNLGENVTNDSIDTICEIAQKNGAYGGKVMGAGGGGFLCLIAPPEKQAQIRAALPQIKIWVPFRMEENGAQVVFHNSTFSSLNEGQTETTESPPSSSISN